jgi:light-regulated signal transduction histidine kinase (bacteriophytochrome)
MHLRLVEKIGSLPSSESIKGLVSHGGVNMCTLIPHCTGAAIVMPTGLHTYGKVPSDEFIRRILSIVLPKHHAKKLGQVASQQDRVVGIECISDLVPNMEGLVHLVAGMMSVPIDNKARASFLVWFRPEFRNTVNPKPQTPNPSSSGSAPSSAIRQSKPQTLNPKP